MIEGRPPTRPPLLLGLGAVVFAVYALVAVATVRTSGRHVRPLFEGVGPPPAYQWVKPPADFAAGNVKPHRTESTIPLGPGGSPLTGVGSADGQLSLNLPEGAVGPHEADSAVVVTITPLAPAPLGPVPPELRADGNAYRVELVFQPSHAPVESLAKDGNVVVVVPEPAEVLLSSPDGRAWQRVPTQQVGGLETVGSTFSRPGYYLAGAPASTGRATTGGSGSGSTGRVVAVAVLTAGLALALGFGPGVVRRARRGRRPPGRPGPSRRGR